MSLLPLAWGGGSWDSCHGPLSLSAKNCTVQAVAVNSCKAVNVATENYQISNSNQKPTRFRPQYLEQTFSTAGEQ